MNSRVIKLNVLRRRRLDFNSSITIIPIVDTSMLAMPMLKYFKDKYDKSIVCNLVMDEISIKKHIEYHSHEKKFYGYVEWKKATF